MDQLRSSATSARARSKRIADYCESDVVGTYQMWLRYELFRGTLTQNAFEASHPVYVRFGSLAS